MSDIKFEWLKEYKQLEYEISLIKWQLNKTKIELARFVSGDLMNVKLEKESRSSNLESIIHELEKELEFKKEQMTRLNILINSFRGIDQLIIRLKYIDGKSLEQIAEELNYSTSHIRKRHSEIRRYLSFLKEYEDNIRYYRSETLE